MLEPSKIVQTPDHRVTFLNELTGKKDLTSFFSFSPRNITYLPREIFLISLI